MLFGKSRADTIIAGGTGKIVEFCDNYLTAGQLEKHLESADPMSRKDLCRYLDVGESTLAGWLKADRIPRTAKHAIVLRLLLPHLQPLKEEPTDPRLVESDDGYQICEFHRSDDGDITGRVIARGIPDVHRGRLLVAGIKLDSIRERGLRLLRKSGGGDAFGFLSSYFSNESADWTPEELKLKAESEQLEGDIRLALADPDRFSAFKLPALLRRNMAVLAAAVQICLDRGQSDVVLELLLPFQEIGTFLESASDHLVTRTQDPSKVMPEQEAAL